jgi:uncharacterized phage protein (TIGR01671 family)
MNDRFKFRVKIKCNNCKKSGYQYWHWNGQFFNEDCFDACGCDSPAMEIVGKLEQCIGKKDNAGKLIFAGDVIKMKFIALGKEFEVEGVVRYNKKECCFKVKDISFSPRILNIEIIGNTKKTEKS